MTLATPRASLPLESARVPGSAPAVAAHRLHLRLSRPTSIAVVVHVAGEWDDSSAGRVREFLEQRLASTAETVVVDLSEVEFLSVAGLELLAHARQVAEDRDTTLRVVDGPVCVDRALRAAEATASIPRYPGLNAAIADLGGRTRENAARTSD